MKNIFFLILLTFTLPAFAAVSANTVWEIRTGASSINGGGFVTGASGTDYSQQNAAQYALSGLTSSGANAIILTASASADMVGNIIQITSGTNFTTGFYQITAVSVGVSITVDRNDTTGVGAAGVGNVGGAYKLGAATDSTFFTTAVAGNTWWIKNDGTTHSTTVNDSPTVGTATAMSFMKGYQTTRGDVPQGTNRPSLNMNSAQLAIGFTEVSNLIVFGAAANMFQLSGGARAVNVKVTNNASIAGPGRNAINCTGNCQLNNVEAISWNGNALNIAAAIQGEINGSYLHDSNVCINLAANTGTQARITNNILASCQAEAVNVISAVIQPTYIVSNTFYGQETPIASSVGVKTITGSSGITILNNIFYGFATGMANPDAGSANYNNYNDFFNNTADISTWAKGPNSFAVAPGFGSVTNIRGTTATTSGQVLTDSGANFSAVVDNQDTVYVSASTGGTLGAFLITAHTSTTITVSSAIGALGTGTAVTYAVTLGHNFAVGPNVVNRAFPGPFPASLTTGYLTIGAAQKLPGAPRKSGGR